MVFKIPTSWLSYYILGCFNRQFLCTKPTAVSYFVVLMSLPPIAAIFVPFRTAMSSYKKHFIFKTFQIKNSHNLTYSMIFQRRQKIRENTVLIGHNCLFPNEAVLMSCFEKTLSSVYFLTSTIKKWNVWWFSRKKSNILTMLVSAQCEIVEFAPKLAKNPTILQTVPLIYVLWFEDKWP